MIDALIPAAECACAEARGFIDDRGQVLEGVRMQSGFQFARMT
jgi:hypothetical protein